MALASPHTFTPGELLTAANLQQIETNILTNPISLISPTTGGINFNLSTGHQNLVPTSLTASSGSTGNVLTISAAGIPVWGAAGSLAVSPAGFTTMSSGETLIGTSSGAAKSLTIGTSGTVLAVTSSNSDPLWRDPKYLVPQTLYFTSFTALSGGSTSYYGPSGVDTVSPANVAITVPDAGVITNMRIGHSASPGASATFTNTLMVGGVATTMTATTTGSNTVGSDTGSSIPISAGNSVALQFQSTTGANATRASASVDFLRTS